MNLLPMTAINIRPKVWFSSKLPEILVVSTPVLLVRSEENTTQFKVLTSVQHCRLKEDSRN